MGHTASDIEQRNIPAFTGSAAQRGRAATEHFPSSVTLIERAIQATASILQDRSSRRWLDASMSIIELKLPASFAFLEGAAEAADASVAQLMAINHAAFLMDGGIPRAVTSLPDTNDGCSVGAGRLETGGAWLVKNRDSAPSKKTRHYTASHSDPSWGGRVAWAQSTIGGGCMASSSGINSDGLAVASTAIALRRPPPGVFRNLLLGELLERCATVDEALEVIIGVPHLGGTVTLADAAGSLASVELAPDAIAIERPVARAWVSRTNHHCSRAVNDETSDEIATPDAAANSRDRLKAMQSIMHASGDHATWDSLQPWLAKEMASHEGPGAVCVHRGNAVTVATTIFTTAPVSMVSSVGPACDDLWIRSETAADGGPQLGDRV